MRTAATVPNVKVIQPQLKMKKPWPKWAKLALLLGPAAVLALLFVYYPFIKNIVYSVTIVNNKGEITGFCGLENYEYVFRREDFMIAIKNTLLLAAITVPASLIVSLSLAMLANKRRPLSPIYETLFCLPMAISMSAACMIFKSMFSPTLGIINRIFGTDLLWFESQDTALITCIILSVWMGVGFDYLLFLSALRGIPAHIMEAGRLDGAGLFTRIFKIQLPLISPTILYVVCTNIIGSMMASGPMIIITQGGPSRSTTTLMYMMFKSGFGSSNYCLAAVVSIIAFLMTLGFTILTFVFERKKVHYQ